MYIKRISAPQQDEANAVMKSLYVCEALGCGWISDRKAKYCIDHATAPQRVETENEYLARHASDTAEATARA